MVCATEVPTLPPSLRSNARRPTAAPRSWLRVGRICVHAHLKFATTSLPRPPPTLYFATIGVTPPFVKNCTLSREPEVRDVRPIRRQDYIIEQLASVA